jgi:hypothetical protein
MFPTKYLLFPLADSWESNWVYSEHPGKEFGKFKLTAGKFFNDAEADKGVYLVYFLLVFNYSVVVFILSRDL